jgi:predicted nucleic acid-binding protein
MIKKVKVYIDSNIPMYAAGQEHPNKEPSIKILELVSSGKVIGVSSTEVLQEILYRYQAINILKKGLEVFDNFSKIIDDVLPVNFQIMNEARDILEKNYYKNLFPRDAVHVATMNYYEINYIATYDKHFKIFKHIKYMQA